MQIPMFKYNQMDNNPEVIFSELTIITIKGEPWFIAKEVCDAIGIKNARDAVASLDEDEKLTSVIPTSGQNR
jgi:Prophage antirepressor